MKINKYLPIIGFASLATIVTPAIASCSCKPLDPEPEDQPIELKTHFEVGGTAKVPEYDLRTEKLDIEANQTYSIIFDLKDWDVDLPPHLEFGYSAILGSDLPQEVFRKLFINNNETAFVPLLPGGPVLYIMQEDYTSDSIINVQIAFDRDIIEQPDFHFYLRYIGSLI